MSSNTPPPEQPSGSSNKSLGKFIRNPTLFLVVAAVVVIIFAIVITSSYQTQVILSERTSESTSFSKIITVGPVWNTNSWTCTSDKDFMVHGALRGIGGAQFSIRISDLGSQSLYTFLSDGAAETFSVGSPANHNMIISRTGGVTGWITLQTSSDAQANCIPS